MCVGLVGAGQMGRGLISQIQAIEGMAVPVVADIDLDAARSALEAAGRSPEEAVVVDSAAAAEGAVAAGKAAVLGDGEDLCAVDGVDVVVEATGVPEVGAEIALTAIEHRRHVIMLNVETDVTVGFALHRRAQEAGVVYSGSAGDEPAATLALHDFARTVGFEVVALGKGKNNPLDRKATAESLREEARQNQMNPKMLASFVDGTKTMVEMTALANATGLVPDVRGMHGPEGGVDDLTDLFRLESEGGILQQTGVVDYVRGVAPGVFAIVTSDQATVHRQMQYLKMGEGPTYVLYRPYHLTSLETPVSVALAALEERPTIVPRYWMAETVAVAKRDLQAGEPLEGIGGSSVYGTIVRAVEAREEGLLPVGLITAGAAVTTDVRRGTPLRRRDVSLDEGSVVASLREEQEQLWRDDGLA